MPDFPDYYVVLGVTPDAPPDEIDAAYLDLCKVEATAAGIKRIQEAYDLLRHPGKRRDYDVWYHNWRAAPGQRARPPQQSVVSTSGAPVHGVPAAPTSRQPSRATG